MWVQMGLDLENRGKAAEGKHEKKDDPPCVLVWREKTKISLIRTPRAAFIAPWSVFCVRLGINLGSGSPFLNVFRVKSSPWGNILYMCKDSPGISLRQRFWGFQIGYGSDHFNVAHMGKGGEDWYFTVLCFQLQIWHTIFYKNHWFHAIDAACFS